jgi:hypothetical protein
MLKMIYIYAEEIGVFPQVASHFRHQTRANANLRLDESPFSSFTHQQN